MLVVAMHCCAVLLGLAKADSWMVMKFLVLRRHRSHPIHLREYLHCECFRREIHESSSYCQRRVGTTHSDFLPREHVHHAQLPECARKHRIRQCNPTFHKGPFRKGIYHIRPLSNYHLSSNYHLGILGFPCKVFPKGGRVWYTKVRSVRSHLSNYRIDHTGRSDAGR